MGSRGLRPPGKKFQFVCRPSSAEARAKKEKKEKKEKKGKTEKKESRKERKKELEEQNKKKKKKDGKQEATRAERDDGAELERGRGAELACPIANSITNLEQTRLGAFKQLYEEICARNPGKKVFFEFYAGAGKAAARASSHPGMVGIAIDYQQNPAWDLHTPGVLPFLKAEIPRPRVGGGHLGTECLSFSSARHGTPGSGCPPPLRDYGEHVWGKPDLSQKDQMKVDKGNMDARLSMDIIESFMAAKKPISMENGNNSIIWHLPKMKKELLPVA